MIKDRVRTIRERENNRIRNEEILRLLIPGSIVESTILGHGQKKFAKINDGDRLMTIGGNVGGEIMLRYDQLTCEAIKIADELSRN